MSGVTDDVLGKFESRDPRDICDGIWAILACGDPDTLRELHPHLPRLREIAASVDLGGMVRRNADNAELAFRYVEDAVRGVCRCALYAGDNFFAPTQEAQRGFVVVLSSQVHVELYEEHFHVRCTGCARELDVREVHGWHVPWYAWTPHEATGP